MTPPPSIEEAAKRVLELRDAQSRDSAWKSHTQLLREARPFIGLAFQLAEWVERVLASWGDFGGDLVCSARCRFGYLEGNGEGSDKDPALCRCGRVALERLLDGVPVEVPTAPE